MQKPTQNQNDPAEALFAALAERYGAEYARWHQTLTEEEIRQAAHYKATVVAAHLAAIGATEAVRIPAHVMDKFHRQGLFLTHYRSNGANTANACKRSGIMSRSTVLNWRRESDTFDGLMHECEEECCDNVESAVYKAALGGQVAAMFGYLKKKRPAVWSDKLEVTGNGLVFVAKFANELDADAASETRHSELESEDD